MFLELPEQPPVEEDGLEGELWAKPFVHLWQNRPPSLKREKEYNRRMGLQAPYCSVCSLFQTYQRVRKERRVEESAHQQDRRRHSALRHFNKGFWKLKRVPCQSLVSKGFLK